MIGRQPHVVLDCPGPAALAGFYIRLLGQPFTHRGDDRGRGRRYQLLNRPSVPVGRTSAATSPGRDGMLGWGCGAAALHGAVAQPQARAGRQLERGGARHRSTADGGRLTNRIPQG